MQPPQDPFAALGLTETSAKSGSTTLPLDAAGAAVASATTTSVYNNFAIPPIMSSDASISSGMSSSVASTTDAPSVVSTTSAAGGATIQVQNPFDALIPSSASPHMTLSPSPSITSVGKMTTGTVAAPSESNPFPALSAAAAATAAASTMAPPPTPPRIQQVISPPLAASSPSSTHLVTQPGSPLHPAQPVLPLSQLPQQPQQLPQQPHPPHPPHNAISTPSLVPQLQEPLNSVILFDDDENTAPSSAANTLEQQPPLNQTFGISRFLENTKRRMTSTSRRDSEDNEIGSGTIISGYLQKLGRNGKWQTRWFESDGECLSYYKSDKRSKLLATLDLQNVGRIEIDPEDKTECSFRIQVLGRLYNLRADNRATCSDWVINLNRVKEANLHQGNVKLVGGTSTLAQLTGSALDLMNATTGGGPTTTAQQSGTPRVVVVSNRQRTRAVDQDEAPFDQLIRVDDPEADPSDPAYNPLSRRSALSTVVVARWTKHQSSLQRMGTKLGVWARSLKKYSCVDGVDGQVQPNAVYLDRHVHPPGHDDKLSSSTKQQRLPPHLSKPKSQAQSVDSTGAQKGYGQWLQKETASAAMAVADSTNYPSDAELVVTDSGVSIKPMVLQDRSVSTASSDYDARMIS